MNEEKLIYQIALTLIPGIGDINGKRLVAYCGGLEAVFKEKKSALLKIPGIGSSTVKSITNRNVFNKAEKEMKFIKDYKIQTYFYLDEEYPHRLKNCVDSPMLLYYKGNTNLNSLKMLSVVGTRRITDYGRKICEEFIEELSDVGVCIISGLAYGVDTLAHRASLKNNLATIGVLAHGLDRIYPSVNKALAEKMLKSGGLLSEFRSGTKPDRENFPKRNRIVAGLCDAVLVIESAQKGGALITAEIANSYNRDVFAIPGQLHSKFSEGCNFLIKTHRAALVQSAGDIMYLLNWNEKSKSAQKQTKIFVELSSDEKLIVDILAEYKTLSIDKISVLSAYQTSKVSSILLNLEFQGIIKCLPGKVYQLY